MNEKNVRVYDKDIESVKIGLEQEADRLQRLRFALLPWIMKATEAMDVYQIRRVLQQNGIDLDLNVIRRWIAERQLALRPTFVNRVSQIFNRLNEWVCVQLPTFRRIFFKPIQQRNDSQNHKNRGDAKVDGDQCLMDFAHFPAPLSKGCCGDGILGSGKQGSNSNPVVA